MSTIPPISETTHTKLIDVRQRMHAMGHPTAPVFVPVGPDPGLPAGQQPPLRVLFVGQIAYKNPENCASVQEGPPDCPFAEAAAMAAAAQAGLLHSSSAFWRAIRAILRQALGAVGAMSWTNRLPEVAGWSNLAKVHLVQEGTRNPPSAILKPQTEACISALQEEIERAQPTATVLMTGSSWGMHEILLPAFGGDDAWHQSSPDADRVAVQYHPRFGPLLWTAHPNELSFSTAQVEAEVLGFVGGYIANLARQAEGQRA